MATTPIRTVRSVYPELFSQLPRVRMVDAPVHTDAHPFCGNPTCPCHRDKTLIEEYLVVPNRDGLLTADEGLRLLFGAQL